MALANTDKLTSQLAMLPDNALRQMAQMHKNDPYVLPLIIAEDGRRKQLRMAGQAQQYRPQPKVAEAQAAQVGTSLPEEVGIGMLPAPNMAQMAGGGITGEEESQTMADGGTAAFHNGENVKRYSGEFGSFVTSAEDLALDELRRQALLRQRAEDARISALVEGRAVPSVQTEAPRVAAPVPATPAAPTQRDEGGQKERPAEKPPAPPGGTKTNMQSLDALYENLRKKYGPEAGQADPFAEQRKALTEAKTSERRQALEDFEKDVAARTPFGAEREKRLIAKEEKLGRDEGQLGGLALLEAGLAIMGGTSPYAAANIGAGAGVGLKAYKQGKKEIEDARDKLDDARSLIDEYRRNETELTKKERRGLQRDIRNAQTEGLESLLSGAEKMYGFAREDVKTMLGAAVTERAAHIKGGYELQAAGMRASAGQDQKLAALAQRTLTDIRNAAQKQFPYPTQNAQREKFVNEQLAQALQYNPDLAQYMGAAGGGGAPSAAPSFRYNQQTGQVEPVR